MEKSILLVIFYDNLKCDQLIQYIDFHKVMLDRINHRGRQPYEELSNFNTKFKVDEYHNPYLTKLTIKIHPKLSQISQTQKFKIYTPLHNHENITVKQSVPLYKSSKLLLSLNWRQDIRNTYNLTHMGISTTYKFNTYYQFKYRTMVGVSWMNQLALRRTIQMNSGKNLILYGTYNGFKEDSGINYHSVGVGGVYNGIDISLQQKLQSDLSLRVSYQKIIANQLYLRLRSDTQINSLNTTDTIIEAGLGYYWSKNISTWLKTVFEPQSIEQKQVPNISVQVQARFKNDAYVASVQLRQNKSIFYLGYKCPSFNLIFPVFGIQSPIPAIVGICLYAYGYFNRKKQKLKKSSKKTQDKINQLKLISDKANQNYHREQTQKGLLIQQVFIGSKDLLMEFLNEQNRILGHHKQQYKDNIFDVTVSFRFYVQKGILNIPSGNKKNMLGCYYEDDEKENIKIYIRYKKGQESHEAIFNEGDQILL